MLPKNAKLTYILMAVLTGIVLLTFFVKPKAGVTELVVPSQEWPDFEATYPGQSRLKERLGQSFGLAMVLVQSPYTQNNVIALEAARSWAKGRFDKQADFLHPVSLEQYETPGETVLDALAYNLFAGPRYLLEDCMAAFLKWRIEEFHETGSYASFRNAFFDLFGLDSESATLLARYQSDRAREAIDSMLWAFSWTLTIAIGLITVAFAKPTRRYARLQKVLSFAWIYLAFNYLYYAWCDNQVSVLVSAFACLALGLFIRYPFYLSRNDQGSLTVQMVNLSSSWIAFSVWASYTLALIQIVTWIHTGSLVHPDPVSLVLSGFNGDFLHDPVFAKRVVDRTLGFIWMGFGLWTLYQQRIDAIAMAESEESLASLRGLEEPAIR